jgi:hypothetical protein
MSRTSLQAGLRFGLPALVAAALTACGGGGGDPGAPVNTMGTLRVSLTDAPACGFDHVYVTVEKVRVHSNAAA